MPPENHLLPGEDTPGHSLPKLAEPGGTFGLAPTGAEPLSMLREMFEEVRRYLLGKGREQQERVGANSKGDITRAFDAHAEQIALTYARARLSPVRVLSEESGEQRFGSAAPRYTLVIDPCDGSNNFKRGVRVAGSAVAVLPGDAPALAQAAFVGDIFTRGFFGNEHGQPLRLVEFTTSYPVLAAGNQDLAQRLAQVLSE
jgi:fructose-1,6-bisphosphatase/inositol monophosphatase family enzyme